MDKTSTSFFIKEDPDEEAEVKEERIQVLRSVMIYGQSVKDKYCIAVSLQQGYNSE